MAKKFLPDPKLLRKLLRYDPETGKLYWKERSLAHFRNSRDQKIWNTRFAGSEALYSDIYGYRQGRILGRSYRAHRVIWAIAYGKWPDGEIDHVNGDRSDNRISNLRSVTRSANSKNLKRPVNNTSGFIGVSRSGKKWRAHIKVTGRYVHIGTFDTKELAVKARSEAERRQGFHANHGR